jgi:hypothetical protein
VGDERTDERGPSTPHNPEVPRSREADAPTPDTASDSGRSLVRVTVNLTPRAVEALDLACARTKDTKTDTINRALVVYNVVLGLLERGGGSLTFQTNDDKTETVHLL